MNELLRKLFVSVVLCLLLIGCARTIARAANSFSFDFTSRVGFHTIFFDGMISGKVTKTDGVTPIVGATVKALQGTSTIATTTTNATGDYTLASLAAGSYRVEASAAGFGTKTQSLVSVVDSQTTTVNLNLDEIVIGPISYIYDALGRLVAAVGPSETTIYSYDSVGNLLSISRQPSTQLAILSVVPSRGSVGQMVTINGTGFGTSPSVQFNSVAADVISANNTRIITTVPAVGVTGQIQLSVTTAQGTVNAPFTVLATESGPIVQVAPRYISLLPSQTLQFYATVSGITGDQSVQWSVNGIHGGDSYVGTISAAGFYTAPAQPGFVLTIKATSVANPSVSGQAQVTVLNSSFAEALIAGSVSALRQASIGGTFHAAISVRRQPTDSVRPVAKAVSIRRLLPADSGAPVAGPISVRRNDVSTSGASHSAGVALTTGPVVHSLTPTSASKGTTFTITINGANFGGTTGLSFLTAAGVVDSTISVSNITVEPDGTSLTADLTASGSTALGPRIVVVTTAAGNSLTVSVGVNVLEIVQ